ncbi:hypothetical protein [Streptomyces sp. NPDC048560]|uniref:hypothetical protein n=1 Tax=Streptomyces sp. NPDC048560 TaxID=3155488 RepID=UPI00343570C4
MVKRGRPEQAQRDKKKRFIAVAGEGLFDRKVLGHLISELHPGTCPKIVHIGKQIHLAAADRQLRPRLDELRRLAQAMERSQGATLAAIAVHVDFDGVEGPDYAKTRQRISSELENMFSPGCDTALALSAFEMEAWLMLFPDAFPKVRPGWKLSAQECRRNLGMIENAKEHLKRLLKQPPYRESDAPAIAEQAARLKLVVPAPSGTSRSYVDFAGDLSKWRK